MRGQRWVEQQIADTILQWDRTLNQRYPETRTWSDSPAAYVTHLTETCNYLRAVRQIDFSAYLERQGIVMDLGCGGGWLSAHLSSLPKIEQVYALDSSHRYLEFLLPQVVDIMKGVPEKVITVEGLFSPLLLPDGSLDAVAASSVLHHADNLESMLVEIRRVLKKNGLLFVLNEFPMTSWRHLLSVSKAFAKMFIALATKSYASNPQSISSGAYVNEPYLGDRCYAPWYWKKAIEKAGFELLETVDTGLPTVAGGKGLHLTHFICRAQ